MDIDRLIRKMHDARDSSRGVMAATYQNVIDMFEDEIRSAAEISRGNRRKRLTFRTDGGIRIGNIIYRAKGELREAIEKCADYEDLEMAGRVVIKPCSLGEIVYTSIVSDVIPMKVTRILWEEANGEEQGFVITEDKTGFTEMFRFVDFGSHVFPTEQECRENMKRKGGKL